MKQIILIGVGLLISCFGYGQISTGELPYSWTSEGGGISENASSVIVLPQLNMTQINQEDSGNEGAGGPTRFGFSHDVDISLTNSGSWITTSDGGHLWTVNIISPDALSLNILYDQFWLPDGAKLFIYASDLSQHIGAFTSLNNKGTKEAVHGFATGFLFTNSITLEYYEPANVTENGIVSISKIISGYRYVHDIVENTNNQNADIYSCNKDINCSEGANWQQEKNAVAFVVMGGSICTGALLNTTANDNRPHFLTANHCFETNMNAEQWTFYWNYEASSCNGTASLNATKSTSGASLLARRVDTDFTLLNLLEDPAFNPNVTVYYLGWDRTNGSATSGVGIHHPKGAQKKISIENNTINNYSPTICWGQNCSNGTSPSK